MYKSCIADTLLSARFNRAKPSLVFLQNLNDPFFTETASRHRLPPQLEHRLTSNPKLSGEQVMGFEGQLGLNGPKVLLRRRIECLR